METEYSRYEPIFGSWYITKKIGEGAEGKLFQIRREDELGNVYLSALKVITIPSGGDQEIRALMSSGMGEEDLELYYGNVVNRAANEFSLMYKLKGNSHIVSYEDHVILRHHQARKEKNKNQKKNNCFFHIPLPFLIFFL